MITRFCFVRLAPEHAHELGRAAVLARARAVADDAGVIVRLGVPADDSAAKWDVAIAVDAPSLDALAAAQLGAAWLELDAHLATHAIVVKTWNFAAA